MEEPQLSLTQARRRVAGYAAALHEDMSIGGLESLEDDLFRFGRIVASTPALRTALTDRDLDLAARQGLVHQLLEGKVPATTLALVRYVVTGGRARDVVGTLDFLVEQTAEARGWRIAHVRAAAPIDETQQTMLTESLAAAGRAAGRAPGGHRRGAAQRRADPHRRPPGGRNGTRTDRRAARAPRPDGVAAGRVRPRRP